MSDKDTTATYAAMTKEHFTTTRLMLAKTNKEFALIEKPCNTCGRTTLCCVSSFDAATEKARELGVELSIACQDCIMPVLASADSPPDVCVMPMQKAHETKAAMDKLKSEMN